MSVDEERPAARSVDAGPETSPDIAADSSADSSGLTAELQPASKRDRQRKRRRRPVRRTLIVTHRWLSLILGIGLLVITTSGALVLYSPEYFRVTHSSIYETTTSPNPISAAQAVAIVDRAHPDFKAGSFNFEHGLYEVGSSDEATGYFYGVDPGSGRITGRANPNTGPMAFLENLHECFLTCDSYPGYVGFLEHPVPSLGMKWLSDLTWASFILALGAVMLLFLVGSGAVLWWPGVRRWSHGFRVRWKKGRYARDYDLHQVLGMAALPFLLMWGLTGAGFELNFVNTAWYTVTGGQTPAEEQYDFASTEVTKPATPDIGLDAASSAAIRAAGGGKLVYADLPAADDATGYYSMYLAKGHDPYRHGLYPGAVAVAVDRHDATHVKVMSTGNGATLSNTIWDEWGAPVFHYGVAVNGWWRLGWLAFGLMPLVLAGTGISTWLAKRGVKKRRREAAAT